MKNNSIPSLDNDKERVMHPKSNNIEIISVVKQMKL